MGASITPPDPASSAAASSAAASSAAASRAVRQLRWIAIAEGISFLVLLGIAMPLKYLAGMPMAVKVVGWAHGVLFVVLVLALIRAKLHARWSLGYAAVIFIAALLPFGPFVIERRLRRD
jgi:integral membrane protein